MTTSVFSINDRYTPTRDRFESVDAFLAMCRSCFGEAPALRESTPGEWTDVATGERVLEAAEANHGTLYDHATGEELRPATAEEEAASIAAAEADGGHGVIEVDGRSCYVQSYGATDPDPIQDAEDKADAEYYDTFGFADTPW